MVKRATIADLARASGVSVATVDRVLNGRLPVRPDTVRRVTEAAAAIGFHAAGLIQQRMRNDLPEYRLGFLLQKPTQPFYRNFAAEIETAVAGAQAFRGVAVIDYWMSQAPDDIAAKLTALSGKVDALAIVSPDHPTVNAAAEKAKGRGVPVFSLLSDCAAGIRQAYLGVDNRKVGRTAAWMIAKCARAPGKVAIFVGSHRWSTWRPGSLRITPCMICSSAIRISSAATWPAAV
jgi:LacI family transcriptional regulator